MLFLRIRKPWHRNGESLEEAHTVTSNAEAEIDLSDSSPGLGLKALLDCLVICTREIIIGLM